MFFEDFEIGLVLKTESKKITKEEIINFAKNYDPQDFHIDENKAKNLNCPPFKRRRYAHLAHESRSSRKLHP